MNNISLTTYNELAVKIDAILLQLHISDKPQKTGRPRSLTLRQVVTLGVYKQVSSRATKKSVYEDFKEVLGCSYKTVVVSINHHAYLVLLLVSKLLEAHRASPTHPMKHIDGSVIPVCLKKNAKHHKTMKDYAGWTKTSTDWYYGLKLHMVSDLRRKVLNVIFTPANTDERSVVINLITELEGLFIMDAGYVSAKLERDIFVEGKRMSLIQPRANMKKLATTFQRAAYQTRFQIEFNFRDLKMFLGLVTSLPRSVKGYFANYFCSLLGYLLA